jgi:O-antigen/teichoic acid export membrane protein
MSIAERSAVEADASERSTDAPVASPQPSSLAVNSVAQALPLIVGYVLSFASAPVILAGLGLRNFGIWALTGALAQYGALLDLGTGISIARYVATHHDDRRLCGEYLAIGWASVVAIAVLLGGLAVAGAGSMAHVVGGISAANMRLVLLCSVTLLACSMASGVIAAFPQGRRRMLAPNVALAVGSVLNFVASVGSIAAGAGLPGYAVANAIAGLTSVGVVAAIVVRVEGGLPWTRPRAGLARPFLSFSIKNQLVRVMDLVNYQTDKIVIAFAVGPAAAGAYELANRVAMAVRQVGIYLTSAMGVELAALVGRLGIDGVRTRYARFTAFSATFGFPPVLLAMATAPLLLRAWLSHIPPDSVGVLVGLCAAYLVAVSTAVGYGVAWALGQPGLVARTASATAVVNIMLTAALAPLLGIWGVLAGTAVALTGGALVQVYVVLRRYGIATGTYLGAVAPALRAYVLLAIPVAAISYSHLFHSRGGAAVALVVLSLAYVAGCATYAARTGRLPAVLIKRFPALGRVRAAA